MADQPSASAEETLHYLVESLLPLCDHARITRGEPVAPPSGGSVSTTVAAEVTCPECLEWLHG